MKSLLNTWKSAYVSYFSAMARSSYQVKPELIVFDKDGTLIDFDHMWSTWVEKLAHDLKNLTGTDMSDAIYRELGYIPS